MAHNEPYSPPRCPTLVRLTPNGPTLSICTVYQLLVRFNFPVPPLLITDPCALLSLLYRATCSIQSRICVPDDAPTTDTIVPYAYTPPSLPTGQIISTGSTHATTVKLRACKHCIPNDAHGGRNRLRCISPHQPMAWGLYPTTPRSRHFQQAECIL